MIRALGEVLAPIFQFPESVSAPGHSRNRRSGVPPQVHIALLGHILIKPDFCLDEMADFILD